MSEIKRLTDKLKKGSIKETVKVENIKTPTAQSVDDEFFNELRTKLKACNYNKKATTYLDVEISQALSIIKTKGKIPIGDLVSYILEDWINKNQGEIKKLSSNKYI